MGKTLRLMGTGLSVVSGQLGNGPVDMVWVFVVRLVWMHVVFRGEKKKRKNTRI